MLPADEVRTRGDATSVQRAELHQLIAERAVDTGWKTKFYEAVCAAEGLSRGAADDALLYLRSLAPAGQTPGLAIPAQGEAMRELTRRRIVPGPLERKLTKRFNTGELTYAQADRAIREWLKLPARAFVAASQLRPSPGAKAPDGYFALLVPGGGTRCYRIHTLTATNRRVVDHIIAADGTTRRVRGVPAELVLREVAANPDPAARLYGQVRHRCSACNQPLRDKTQPGYPHGYGEKCWNDKLAALAATPDPRPLASGRTNP